MLFSPSLDSAFACSLIYVDWSTAWVLCLFDGGGGSIIFSSLYVAAASVAAASVAAVTFVAAAAVVVAIVAVSTFILASAVASAVPAVAFTDAVASAVDYFLVSLPFFPVSALALLPLPSTTLAMVG